jgi:hypothetical protein
MSEMIKAGSTVIPEALMVARLAQSEQMREFFIQIWKQNPALARQGGTRVQNLMSPLDQAGRVSVRTSLAGEEHGGTGEAK